MRYLIVGAGAVGGTIGARLHESGREVVLVARGAHLSAMREYGLRFVTPDAERVLEVTAVGSPDAVELTTEDVIVLATKTQDTPAALLEWSRRPVAGTASAAGELVPVLCAQNGVTNERLALRAFARVYAACVWLPATHLEPGLVVAEAAPLSGMLHLGRYPTGSDDTARAVAADLENAYLGGVARDDAMRWKYAKLLVNLGNAFDALFGDPSSWHHLVDRAREEATAVYVAAGIDAASTAEQKAVRGSLVDAQDIAGHSRSGGSTWQSLERSTGSLETDYLNGEIVLLGRLHGVPTPVNAAIQHVSWAAERERWAPRSRTVADVAW